MVQTDIDSIAIKFKDIIRELGENPERDGLKKSPLRIARSLKFLTQGYTMEDPTNMLKNSLFEEDHQHMVIVKDIEIFSLCEHHLLPFFGKAHVAYIPNGKLVGLSKIPRVVDAYAKRLQIQERLTDQIKECINNALNPLGVAVVIEAVHLCMVMRGVQKQNSVTTTSSFTGGFTKSETRNEFFKLISSKLS